MRATDFVAPEFLAFACFISAPLLWGGILWWEADWQKPYVLWINLLRWSLALLVLLPFAVRACGAIGTACAARYRA